MTVEIFKPVVFRGKQIDGYEVSNLGRVKSIRRKIEYWTTNQTGKPFKYTRTEPEKILKARQDKRGYLYISLPVKRGIIKSAKVHRLVAEVFIPNPNKLPTINHKDEDKTNNRLENLEWCTTEYNNKYGSRGDKLKGIEVFKDGSLVYSFESLREASRELGLDRKTIMKFVNDEPQVFRKGGKNTQYKDFIFKLCRR